MNLKYLIALLSMLCSYSMVKSQIVINEGSNRNYTQIVDEDNETNDWIEIYNTSDSAVNLAGWSLSDRKDTSKWIFPNINLGAKKFLLVHASGKDRKIYDVSSVWESPVLPTDKFKYVVPVSAVPNWNKLSYNDGGWKTGIAGFGFDDDDDETIIPTGSVVVYIRKTFSITDLSVIIDAVCHMDYDDGFVAYLNGTEICRGNIDGTPSWNSTAAGNHEAEMYGGGSPEEFVLDMNTIRPILNEGENVFAVEVHNVSNTSSDLSLIPYLSFKINDGNSYYGTAPEWLKNTSGSQLHTNFKITSGGEKIYLYNPQQNLVSLLDVDGLLLDHSIGWSNDGIGDMAIFTEPTPGSSNKNAQAYTLGYSEDPIFSLEAGFYSGKQTVSLSATLENTEIRYTTDGSTPTETSNLFSGTPITINSTKVLTARCFSPDGRLPGKPISSTYLIEEDFTIPVLSVTTDNNNPFGTSGIFTNWRESWNKPCYIEYFDDNKELAITQAAGIQVDGGAGGSRSKPQTSFRIEPGNGTLGDGAVNYNFHPERPQRTNYESLYLRNGSNRYLDLIYKDGAQVRGMGKNTYNFYSEYRPIVVFLNGGYYGMYEGREKINADYLESNYGMSTDSLNMVGISHFKDPRTILPIVGTTDAFFEDYDKFLAMNSSSANFLEEAGEIVDLQNYTDYMAGQIWMTNKDWPHNNMKAWRCEGSKMKWQFALVDLEWSFLPTGSNGNLATRPSFDQINYLNNLQTTWPASGYWYKLMQNDDYKHYFINRLCDLMNTSYDYEVLKQVELEIYEEAISEIPAYYERWGGSVDKFTSNHEDFTTELSTREDYLRQHILNNYKLTRTIDITLNVQPKGAGRVRISTIVPGEYPWKGQYCSDVPISIEAIPNPGYQFSSWNNNKYISDAKSAVFVSEISDLTSSFVANFEEAQEISFDGITISEISYKDGDSINYTDWFEIWNGTSEELSLNGWYFSDKNPSNKYEFQSGLIIPAGERMVVAKDNLFFSSLYPQVKYVTGGFDFGLGSPNDEIKLYNAKDELMVYVKYSDLYPWPLNGNREGRTLELLNPEKSLLNFYNWFAGCYKGSPGTAYDPECGAAHTGMKELRSSAGLKVNVYPNPVQDVLNISAKSSILSVDIYSISGAVIKQFNGIGSRNVSLDLDMNNGVYFVSVSTTEGTSVIKIIIR